MQLRYYRLNIRLLHHIDMLTSQVKFPWIPSMIVKLSPYELRYRAFAGVTVTSSKPNQTAHATRACKNAV